MLESNIRPLTSSEQHYRAARAHWKANRLDQAIEHAWMAYDADPELPKNRILVAWMLDAGNAAISSQRRSALLRLLHDPAVDPRAISVVGWRYLLSSTNILVSQEADVDPALMAAGIEADELALSLLSEDIVALMAAEQPLTRLRRWLLLTQGWRHFPRTTAALVAQAALNGGCWLMDAAEEAHLDQTPCSVALRAYTPERQASTSRADCRDPVTLAVRCIRRPR